MLRAMNSSHSKNREHFKARNLYSFGGELKNRVRRKVHAYRGTNNSKRQKTLCCSYHLCKEDVKRLYKCSYCGDLFCKKHVVPTKPEHPFPRTLKELISSQWFITGHACWPYAEELERLERQGKDDDARALDKLIKSGRFPPVIVVPPPPRPPKLPSLPLPEPPDLPPPIPEPPETREFPWSRLVLTLLILIFIGLLGTTVYLLGNLPASFQNTGPKPSAFPVLAQHFTFVFVDPTPSNNTYLNRNFIFINVTTSKFLNSTFVIMDGRRENMRQDGINWYLNVSELSEGVHIYQVSGIDSRGNWGVSEKRSIVVDITPPSIEFTQETAPDGASLDKKSIDASVQVNEPLSKISYELYDSNNNLVDHTDYDQVQKIQWNSLTIGTYHYVATAVDLAGNFRSTETRFVTIVPPYQTEPSGRTLTYIDQSTTKFINFVVYSGLKKYLAGLSRSYLCDPACPTDRQIEMKFLDEENQKIALAKLAEVIRQQTSSRDDQARIAVSLLQKIPYDWAGFRSNNLNNRYPYEVIYDNTGVCGEKARLLAFLLRELGFGVVLLDYKADQHMAVGIKCPVSYSQYQYDGVGYCFIETVRPAIITDNQNGYCSDATCATTNKLSSSPEILLISDGSSFDSVSVEYNDALEFIRINKLSENTGGLLDTFNYNRWFYLVNKYGIEVSNQ
jgi:hypothetical protein